MVQNGRDVPKELRKVLRTLTRIDSGADLDRLRTGFGDLSERDTRIFTDRKLRRTPRTLEELGRQFGVTRERVRQIEAHAIRKLRRTQRSAPWPDGRLFAVDDFLARIRAHPMKVQDLRGDAPGTVESLLVATYLFLNDLEMNGGYVATRKTWALFRSDLETLTSLEGPTLRLIRRRVERDIDPIDPSGLADLLTSLGIRISPSGDNSRLNNYDRVAAVFLSAGKPLSKSAIAHQSGLTIRQVDSVLNRKESFVWVGLRRFAPVSWGLPPYDGTENALEAEIVLRGGAAQVSDILQSVVDKFGCTRVSCMMYLSMSPRFQLDGDIVRLRTEPMASTRGDAARQKFLYDDQRGGLVWAVDIDADLLRGSGRNVPRSVAAILGLTTDARIELHLPGGAVSIEHTGTQIAASSFRKCAEAMSAAMGDRILLLFRPAGAYQTSIVRPRGRGLHWALACVGSATNGDTGNLALACWEPDRSLFREALWDRQERLILHLLGLPIEDPRAARISLESFRALLPDGVSQRSFEDGAGIGRGSLSSDERNGFARLNSRKRTLLVRYLVELTGIPAPKLSRDLFGVVDLPAITDPV